MYSLSKNIVLRRNCFREFICLQTLVPFSTSSVTQDQLPHNSFIVDYLKNSLGFTTEKAISTSKLISPTITPSNINFVPDLLKQKGFSDTHIKNLISRRPQFLACKDETLKPKLTLLQELGFSDSALSDLIVNNPSILRRGIDNYLKPTISCLQSLLHSDENLVQALNRSSWLLTSNFQKTVGPNVELLRQCSIPDKQISNLLFTHPRYFTQRPDWLKNHISQVEIFGFERGSESFIHAVSTLAGMSKANLEARFDMYKSYGWSDSDVISAFRKSPKFLANSKEKVKASMDFFVGELGYNHKDIASKPNLFTFSLDKKLKPRYELLKILKSRGLVLECDFLSVAILSEKNFLKRCVLRYVEKAPDLQEAYMGLLIDFDTRRKKDG